MMLKPVSIRRVLLVSSVLIFPLIILVAATGVLRARADRPDSSTSFDASQTVPVSMVDFAFQPKVITITVGTNIRWTNNGTFTHTTTSDTGIWNSGDIAPGGMYTVTFNTPGVFPYHCIHHAPAMVGTVVVMGDLFLPLIDR